jgi:hypothetical protein
MSRVKQASKRKTQTKAATVLGVAGALSLVGGASGAAVNPAPTANTAPLIAFEEEISDVSLSTFYVFDHENAVTHRPSLQLAQRRGCGGCGGGAGACSNGGCGGGVGACS